VIENLLGDERAETFFRLKRCCDLEQVHIPALALARLTADGCVRHLR
jgi:hypothetical protein